MHKIESVVKVLHNLLGNRTHLLYTNFTGGDSVRFIIHGNSWHDFRTFAISMNVELRYVSTEGEYYKGLMF